MPDIMVILACLSQCAQSTTLRQLGCVIEAMLAQTGKTGAASDGSLRSCDAETNAGLPLHPGGGGGRAL